MRNAERNYMTIDINGIRGRVNSDIRWDGAAKRKNSVRLADRLWLLKEYDRLRAENAKLSEALRERNIHDRT